MRIGIWVGAILALLATTMGARADVPMPGSFVATAACPAVQSFNKNTNPGNVALVPQQTYRMVSANKLPASHYLLIVPGANPERRWVTIDCGTPTADAGTATPAAATPAQAPAVPVSPTATAASGPTHYVLAISWEPAFCAGHADKPECAAETPTGFDAAHFTLHGLWPDPNEYCGVAPADIATDKAGRWSDLPEVTLTAGTRARLDTEMPGTQSRLERHEWTRHGTCSGVSMEQYFGRELAFLDAINASPVQALFAGRVGQALQLTEIRAAFDQAFGAGAGERIRLACARQDGAREITEITLGLEGDVIGSGQLPELIAAAGPTGGGCDQGIVAAIH